LETGKNLMQPKTQHATDPLRVPARQVDIPIDERHAPTSDQHHHTHHHSIINKKGAQSNLKGFLISTFDSRLGFGFILQKHLKNSSH